MDKREHIKQHGIDELVEGPVTTVTFRVPENLKRAGMRLAANKGMSFSAFVRMCMIERISTDSTNTNR